MSLKRALLSTVTGLGFTAGLATAAISEEITIATVNNADMITMQELAPAWEKATGNSINLGCSGRKRTSPTDYTGYRHKWWLI